MAAQEDCRDYLRTGRCKYGASCKYNHPPNVQSGGGIRDPSNPSEPQYPIRRGEPTCQYYLKHGTCKFGQACKFHHPPQSELAAVMGGSAVVVNVGRNKTSGQQIVLNSIDGSTGTSAMALQFLPQRPDEPDCIYFLRNGRCKYGATCRYHHPVAFHQNKSSGSSPGGQVRRQSQRPLEFGGEMGTQVRSSSSLQFAADIIQSSLSSQGYVQQERREASSFGTTTPTHFVITETPLAVVPGNATGPSTSTSYHRTSRSNSSGMGEEYSVPLNTSAGSSYPVPRDYNSSSSSIASSYETAASAVEFQGEQNGVIWSRPVKRIASGGSLSAYDTTPPLRPQPAYGVSRTSLAPSVSDNSLASRRLRTESMGSTSDHSGNYPDAWNQNSQTTSATAGWIEQSSSFEQARRSRHPQFHRGDERGMPQDSGERMQSSALVKEQQRSESHDDGGLSMMTSALLNMLDTPEEAALKSYSSSDPPARMNPISPPTTPRSGSAGYSQGREGLPVEDRYLGSPATGSHQYSQVVRGGYGNQASRYNFTSNQYSTLGSDLAQGSMYSPVPRSSRVESRQSATSPSWSPTWQGPPSDGSPQQTNRSMLAIQSPSKAPGASHSSKAPPASNVGLYLP